MSSTSLPLVAALALVSSFAQAESVGPTVGQPSVVGQAPANPADAIVGDWKPADMPVTVRIFPSQGQYLGGIVASDDPALVNKELLRGITYDAASNTWRGEVFALKRGEFVPMTIRATPAGFEMVAGTGLMSKTIEWVRAP